MGQLQHDFYDHPLVFDQAFIICTEVQKYLSLEMARVIRDKLPPPLNTAMVEHPYVAHWHVWCMCTCMYVYAGCLWGEDVTTLVLVVMDMFVFNEVTYVIWQLVSIKTHLKALVLNNYVLKQNALKFVVWTHYLCMHTSCELKDVSFHFVVLLLRRCHVNAFQVQPAHQAVKSLMPIFFAISHLSRCVSWQICSMRSLV